MRRQIDKYNGISILLHWSIAILVIFMLRFGHYMHHLPKGSFERLAAFQMHYSIGILILILSVLRLTWRFIHPAPKLPSTMKMGEKVLAKTVHYLFYILLIAIPLAGWATASTSPLDIPIYFFDLFQWPWFPGIHDADSREIIHEVFQEMHETMGWVMIGLIGLHVLAAIKHTFMDRDGLIFRMLPGKKL